MAEVWRIEDDVVEADRYTGPLDVPASSRCASCGKCCLRMPGQTIPADLGDDWKAEAERRLRTGRWAVDWWDGEEQSYFLRPATVGREGQIFDASWGGRCTFLGDAGCTLDRADRPTVCKALQPTDAACSTGMTKWQVVQEWRPFSAVLEIIARKVQGGK